VPNACEQTNPGEQTVLRAREGIAVPLRAGQRLRVTNLHGGQVVDTWALARADTREYLSMDHTRTSLRKLVPAAGDHLYSSRRRPLLTLIEDTSPGAHDMLIAAHARALDAVCVTDNLSEFKRVPALRVENWLT
jgi:uncharacterized protein YcgI (DUF1989 family)